MGRFNEQLHKLAGTSEDGAEKEAALAPLIQYETAEVAAEAASILSQGADQSSTPAAKLLHSYSQQQLKIGDARLDFNEKARLRFLEPFSAYKLAYESVQVPCFPCTRV